MSYNLGSLEIHAQYHIAELQREAEHERLIARVVAGRGRSLRLRAANALYALADRLEAHENGLDRLATAR